MGKWLSKKIRKDIAFLTQKYDLNAKAVTDALGMPETTIYNWLHKYPLTEKMLRNQKDPNYPQLEPLIQKSKLMLKAVKVAAKMEVGVENLPPASTVGSIDLSKDVLEELERNLNNLNKQIAEMEASRDELTAKLDALYPTRNEINKIYLFTKQCRENIKANNK